MPEIYATDGWESYNLIEHNKHIVGEAHTYTVERSIVFCAIIWQDLRGKHIIGRKVWQ
jgi:IS1 family transposase